MPRTPLILSVVGSSGAGKTTVIERLIPLLREAGLKVGTSKHASHGFSADREGSDSWRHHHAGADTVLLVGPEGAALFLAAHVVHPDPSADPHDDISRLISEHMTDVDVVLAEGYAPLHDLLIEVEREGVPLKPVSGPRTVWATITDRPDGDDRIAFDDLARLVDRILARVSA